MYRKKQYRIRAVAVGKWKKVRFKDYQGVRSPGFRTILMWE